MARIEQSAPNVYNEPHLFAPPSQIRDNEDEHDDDDEAPMLPTNTKLSINSTNIRGPNNLIRIILLTLCLAGLQFTWTVEMAYGTPYLLSLGLTKSFMSLVWIAGPLSGLIMQPIVGVLSDSCRSKWGRRRPFLLGGSVVVVLSLLVIGWTREITHVFTGQEQGEGSFKTVSIVIAIASIYILDFSINCVQASCRALIVDSLPPSLQSDGTAWAGRMVGVGNVAGYFMGYANLVKVFPFFGNTQLKVLCVFATFVLLLCNFVTCYSVQEKVLEADQMQRKSNNSPFRLFRDIIQNIWHLPTPIQRVCNVQFFAWIGWFPFLFYSTTWVAEIYSKTLLEESGPVIDDKVGQATRAGSFAFLVYSLISLSSSFILPLFVSASPTKYSENRDSAYTFKLPFSNKTYTLSFLGYIKLSFLTLPRAWTISHFIFCICMLSTILVSDVTAAAIVIGLCGISWAISMWAPFSLLGEYISEQEAIAAKLNDNPVENTNSDSLYRNAHLTASRISLSDGIIGSQPVMYQPAFTTEDDVELVGIKKPNNSDETEIEEATASNDNEHYEHNYEEEEENASSADNHTLPAAGVLLGIHNMYIVLPQFLVTFFSSIAFRILEKEESEGDSGTDAIGFILRVGAVMAGIAGFISMKIGK